MTSSQGIADLFGDEVSTSLGFDAKESKRRVLIVDDSKMMRFAVAEVIRKQGYEVLEAADGDEALALIARMLQHQYRWDVLRLLSFDEARADAVIAGFRLLGDWGAAGKIGQARFVAQRT